MDEDDAGLDGRFFQGAHERRDLRAHGISDRELQGPAWVRLDQGRYAWSPIQPAGDLDRIRQVLPLLPDGAAVGGWAAAVLHGVTTPDGESAAGEPLPVQLALSRQQTCRRTTGVRTFRSDLADDDVVMVGDVPVTSLVRTGFDLARLDPRTVRAHSDRWSLQESTIWLDALLRDGGLDPAELIGYLEAHPKRLGARQAGRVLIRADGRSASPRETALRLLWTLDAALPRPEVNVPIYDRNGRLLGVADLLDAEAGLVGEYDGADHASPQRRSRDLLRTEGLEAVGLDVFRVTADDFARRADTVQRLRWRHRRAMNRDRRADAWTLLPIAS
jgi:hypothetical protein